MTEIKRKRIKPIRRVVTHTDACGFCGTLLPGGIHRGDCPYKGVKDTEGL